MTTSYTPIKQAGQKDTLIGVNENEEDGRPSRGGEKKSGGIMDSWNWFMAKPWERFPFAIFLLFAILTILWLVLYVTDDFTGYLLGGLAAIIMSLYGANHFRTLLSLKEQVDQLAKLNNQFRRENAELATEVDNLTRAKETLQNVSENLRNSNAQLKDQLKKFQELDEHLKNISDDSIEGLARLQESSEGVMNTWKQNLIRHEKNLLNKVLDQVEYKDGMQHMTEDEFNEFLSCLPTEWKAKFEEHKITFAKVAGEDGAIDFEEFNKMVDQLTEEKALA